MLYCNKSVESEIREFDFGKIAQICLGEKGRGRQLLALTCPEGVELRKNTLNKELSIGLTKSGKPRIVHKTEDVLYMIVSAEGGYTRRGNGTIRVLKNAKDQFEILGRGNGADGAAGRIGYWDVLLIKAPKNGIIRVRTSGAGYGTESDLYVIKNNEPYHCTLGTLEECCEMIGAGMPFIPAKDDDGNLVYSDEWIIL